MFPRCNRTRNWIGRFLNIPGACAVARNRMRCSRLEQQLPRRGSITCHPGGRKRCLKAGTFQDWFPLHSEVAPKRRQYVAGSTLAPRYGSVPPGMTASRSRTSAWSWPPCARGSSGMAGWPPGSRRIGNTGRTLDVLVANTSCIPNQKFKSCPLKRPVQEVLNCSRSCSQDPFQIHLLESHESLREVIFWQHGGPSNYGTVRKPVSLPLQRTSASSVSRKSFFWVSGQGRRQILVCLNPQGKNRPKNEALRRNVAPIVSCFKPRTPTSIWARLGSITGWNRPCLYFVRRMLRRVQPHVLSQSSPCLQLWQLLNKRPDALPGPLNDFSLRVATFASPCPEPKPIARKDGGCHYHIYRSSWFCSAFYLQYGIGASFVFQTYSKLQGLVLWARGWHWFSFGFALASLWFSFGRPRFLCFSFGCYFGGSFGFPWIVP